MNYSMGNNKGVTMTELIVAAVLLAVGIFGSLKVFRGISQSIFMSQTKQVATTLAREKLEALQVLPYYRLRAQGAPTYYQPGGSGKPYIYYDPYYTPGPEVVQVGTVKYYRGAYVDRVYRDPSSGDLVAMAVATPYQTEAGLKRIKVGVMWKDGSVWKVVDVTGLKENPVRTRGEVKFVGTVTSTAGIPLTGAMGIAIDTIETRGQMINAQPDGSGHYEFAVRPGTYTLRARDLSNGQVYYTVKQTGYVGYDHNPSTIDFVLPMSLYGRVDTTFWWNSNPVLSRVVGSSVSATDPNFNQEWVEIFNPTTWTWDATKLNLHYYMTRNSSESYVVSTAEFAKHKIDANYINTTIPPGGYFLFANTTTIHLQSGAVDADAVWETVNPASNTWWRVDRAAGPVGRFDPTGIYYAGFPNPDIITTATPGIYIMNQTTWVWTSAFTGYYPIQYNGGGGYLRLTYNPTSTTDYAYLDGVGWRGGVDQGGGCVSPAEPLNAEGGVPNRLIDERSGLQDCEGLNAGEQWIRYASTMAHQETRDIGPAYDSDASVRDWSKWISTAPGYFSRFLPRNSTCPAVPVVSGRDPYQRADRLGNGSEAGYVTAFVNDGISYWIDGIKPTYYTGWTPSPLGFCSTCPRSNMFRYTDYDIPWWGRYEFSRVATGTWTLGMYARRKTSPYDYGVSTQVLLNVTQNSYTWWQGVIASTSDKVFLFGTVRDVYDVPLEDVRVDYKFGDGSTPLNIKSRSGGAYSLEISSSVGKVMSGVHLNMPGTGDYLPAYVDVLWGPHEWWGGVGYKVDSCNCPDTHLGYTGFLTGFVQDELGVGIPDVNVSAINAATNEERASGLTSSGGGRPVGTFLVNVATGMYKVKVMTELEETSSPTISGLISLATATMTSGGIFVGTFTITNAYGRRAGAVVANGGPLNTGAVLVLTTSTIAGTKPPPIDSVFRAGNVTYYMASSDAIGRYSFDVKMNTYNLYGFYPYYNSSGVLTWVKRSTAAYVNSGNNALDFPTLDLTP